MARKKHYWYIFLHTYTSRNAHRLVYNFSRIAEAEGFVKVTSCHLRCKSGNTSVLGQDGDVVTTYHQQEVIHDISCSGSCIGNADDRSPGAAPTWSEQNLLI